MYDDISVPCDLPAGRLLDCPTHLAYLCGTTHHHAYTNYHAPSIEYVL